MQDKMLLQSLRGLWATITPAEHTLLTWLHLFHRIYQLLTASLAELASIRWQHDLGQNSSSKAHQFN